MDIHPKIIPKKTNININIALITLLPYFLRGGSFCYPGMVVWGIQRVDLVDGLDRWCSAFAIVSS